MDTGLTEVKEIDVEQLMTRIRENVRQRRSGETSLSENAVPAFDNGQAFADDDDLDSLHDIQTTSFTSHRRVLGPLIVILKKILRKLLTPILERQVAYNAAVVRSIGTLHRRLRQEQLVVRELLAGQAREVLAIESRLRERLEAQVQAVVEIQSRFREEMLGAQLQLRDAQTRLREEMLGAQLQLRDAQTRLREEMLGAQLQLRDAQTRLHDEMLGAQLQLRDTQTRLHDELATQSQAMRQWSDTARERTSRVERKLRRILHALQPDQPRDGRLATKSDDDKPVVPLPELEPAFDYAGFEERFRGSEEDIKERQRSYLQYFEDRENILDIGCGRGEFLELLRERGITARGVDLDLDMVLMCRDKGLDVVREDAFTYLTALPDDSVGGVFAAQVIEHIPPRGVIELVKLCHRKLAPGGTLVLETPNPTCLMVFADSFYRDVSHVHPLHPDTMKFLLEAAGFHRVELRFAAPVDTRMRIPPIQAPGADFESFNESIERLNSLLFGYQDYAVLGRKVG